MSAFRIRCLLGIMLAFSAAFFGCGGAEAVRGDDVEGLDHQAMSTGLDRRDLQKMLDENLRALQSSTAGKRWTAEDRPAVAVIPMRNETSEHIDSALEALISDVETNLINWGVVRVISLENQAGLMEEIRRQYAGGFDQSQVATWGKQIGARYIITGKVFTTDERSEDVRRVQYYMFMQAIAVESGEVLFQNKSAVTKALIK
ncbi:MAG: penicillin-binding protein activator LpoB [Deltaproteobacteria bacterium]|nr:penicillin-binding protein activator LpoB [Deltaproteobacteria bacterium]